HYPIFLFLLLSVTGCKKQEKAHEETTETVENSIVYASGLELYKHLGYTVVKVTNPWPDATETFTYVMQKKDAVVPDSLKKYTTVQVPLQSIVVTSTTHIPAMEMLGRSEEHTSELQSRENLVCRLLLEKKKTNKSTQAEP